MPSSHWQMSRSQKGSQYKRGIPRYHIRTRIVQHKREDTVQCPRHPHRVLVHKLVQVTEDFTVRARGTLLPNQLL
jgi:hypothetical protein